jgi:pSer/pThr/pTyr-binding forkhead associated (FHA) protein
MLGRYPQSDIPLVHEDVSRRHLFLHVIGGNLHALDLGSRTGTWWAEGPRRSGWLLPGQSIRVGPFAIRYVSVGRGASAEAGRDPAAGSLASIPPDLQIASSWPRLALVLQDSPKRQTWRMNRAATVLGSAVGCEPRLTDLSVSKRHCALLRTPRGPWVVDLLSREGFLINNSIARFAPLEDGDHLRFGDYQFKARCKPTVTSEVSSPVPETPAAGASAPPVALAQLERFQEQLFEQFQQIMAMVVQRFDTLHRAQADQIRDELESLVELREDLRGLKADFSAGGPRPILPPLRQALNPPLATAAVAPFFHEPAGAGEPSAAVIHSVQERLVSIRSEQRTRWQRILGFLGGPPREGPALRPGGSPLPRAGNRQ